MVFLSGGESSRGQTETLVAIWQGSCCAAPHQGWPPPQPHSEGGQGTPRTVPSCTQRVGAAELRAPHIIHGTNTAQQRQHPHIHPHIHPSTHPSIHPASQPDTHGKSKHSSSACPCHCSSLLPSRAAPSPRAMFPAEGHSSCQQLRALERLGFHGGTWRSRAAGAWSGAPGPRSRHTADEDGFGFQETQTTRSRRGLAQEHATGVTRCTVSKHCPAVASSLPHSGQVRGTCSLLSPLPPTPSHSRERKF